MDFRAGNNLGRPLDQPLHMTLGKPRPRERVGCVQGCTPVSPLRLHLMKVDALLSSEFWIVAPPLAETSSLRVRYVLCP